MMNNENENKYPTFVERLIIVASLTAEVAIFNRELEDDATIAQVTRRQINKY